MARIADNRFAAVRRLFPHTKDIVYFNCASYGPFSEPVANAIRENIDLRLAANRDDSHDAFACADSLRKELAGFIGARKSEVGISSNTSFGLTLAAHGLPLKRGDEVLVSDVEFPAIIYAWRGAAEARGLKLTYVLSKDRRFDIDAFRRAISKRSKVLALSWVQFFNGFKNDLAELSHICKEHGMYFVVDGIQGVGAEPINVHRLGIDIFSCGCQKWMLSPQGCGFFYVADHVRKQLRSSYITWHSVDWKLKFDDLFKYDLPYFDGARRDELGYYAVLNLLAMRASVDIFRRLGIRNIRTHNYALIDRLADYVQRSSIYRITSTMQKRHRSSIFTFTGPRLIDLHRRLLKSGIICVRREGSIRISVHLFNNESDIDRLIRQLQSFEKG